MWNIWVHISMAHGYYFRYAKRMKVKLKVANSVGEYPIAHVMFAMTFFAFIIGCELATFYIEMKTYLYSNKMKSAYSVVWMGCWLVICFFGFIGCEFKLFFKVFNSLHRVVECECICTVDCSVSSHNVLWSIRL
jgi:hypothetical protein